MSHPAVVDDIVFITMRTGTVVNMSQTRKLQP